MNSSMRTKVAPVERFRGPAACVAAGLLLSACSADVTRFDFPAFSLGQNGDETAALPVPPEPIYQYKTPAKAEDKLPAYGKKSYRTAQADTGISRSNLGRPADSIDTLQPEPRRRRPASVPSYEQESATTSGTRQTTTVQRGDTLYGIARRTGVSVRRIKQANNLAGDSIRIGQRLIIPGSSNTPDDIRYDAPRPTKVSRTHRYDEPRTTARVGDRITLDDRATRRPFAARTATAANGTYRIQSGDSLYAISRKLGVSATRIAEANDLEDPSRLRIGQVLTIPGQSSFGTQQTVSTDLTPRYDQTYGGTRASSKTRRRVASLDRSAGISDESYAPAPATRSRASDLSFRWPVRGRIISRFGGRTKSGNNDGINLAVPAGTSVKAVEDGVVAYAGGELKGYGELLLVRHDDDWVSAYAHNSELLVKRGDKVRRGQVVARAGRTGSVDRPQLHFELRKGSRPVDPLKHLASN